MLTMLRHTLSILLLPFLVAVVMPYWLLTTFTAIDYRWSDNVLIVWLPRLIGAIALTAGFLLFSWCVTLFARVGQGTLAPWDPTRNLVAVGPYRFVRNPMISGVAFILIGEALLWGSWLVGLWASLFIGLNHLYFVVSEEPGLEKRFGEPYRHYKAHVPRWIPRLRPWSGQ
ncbi:MAG: isoprenylcysteine carboxylmethyltransferase family protein [Anaerolineaceae bacterium]|nr:isoprenylcysteine carboxylmethyltransferase family protein [Anaerolineaceae bacterium]